MKTACQILLFLFLFVHTFASDFNPPEWRGLPGSTYQKWEFSTSDLLPLADSYDNPYGTPTVMEAIEGRWFNQFSDHQGVWGSPTIRFEVANDSETLNDSKYRVQIFWNPSTLTPVYLNMYVCDSLGFGPVLQADIVDRHQDSSWSSYTFEVTAAPFDSVPVVYCEGRSSDGSLVRAHVDEVIIDTIVIPEPATLALIGLGGLLLRRKR